IHEWRFREGFWTFQNGLLLGTYGVHESLKACFVSHATCKGYFKHTRMDHGCFPEDLATCDVWVCLSRRFKRRRSSHHATNGTRTNEPGARKTTRYGLRSVNWRR